MKKTILAFLLALGLGFAIGVVAVAAPIAGTPIAQAADAIASDDVLEVWYDRYGRWHPDRRVVVRPAPYVVVPPVVVVPRVPVCRTVRVCNSRGVCRLRQRCT